MKKVLLTAAGYDPSGGAGVLLDVKVFAQFGFHGAAVITALTTQNTRSVKNVYALPPGLIREQSRVLARDMKFAGIKVGMAGSWENLKAIGEILTKLKDVPRVIDPIFRSSSGAWLLDKGAISVFLGEIRGKATVLTPNLDEAGLMIGSKLRNIPDMREAAGEIFRVTRVPCLVKGGHLEGDAVNLLYDGRRVYLFGQKKIAKDVHGTGCYFSAALLCHMARGKSLSAAAELATENTRAAIRGAVLIGRGRRIFSSFLLGHE
ncbi:MAG: bifunctional hydroxymethylpyrimidine kinase/phosphomethylpyrimidine kinase [Candidatus Aminicenantales bacterium]